MHFVSKRSQRSICYVVIKCMENTRVFAQQAGKLKHKLLFYDSNEKRYKEMSRVAKMRSKVLGSHLIGLLWVDGELN